MDNLLRDLRYALRVLSKNPGFACAAVAILAMAIGLNTAVFSVVSAVVLRPLPAAAPEELVRIYASEPGDFMSHGPLAPADYEALRDEVRSLDGVAAYAYTSMVLDDGTRSRLVMGALVTGNYFSLLGVEPAAGRFWQDDDLAAAGRGPEIAVLSHSAWRRRFGSDPQVAGRTLRLNGRAVTILGVAPPDFQGLTRGISPELWLYRPPDAKPGGDRLSEAERREARGLWGIGRRAGGAATAAVGAEVTALAARLRRAYPETHAERDLVAVPADRVRVLPGVDATLQAAAAGMMGVVALVLLVASANLAHLLLARALARRREVATRLALGAPRRAVVRQLLAESLLLALAGGAAGLGVAAVSNALLGNVRLPIPVDLALGLTLDAPVFLFSLAASTATAIACGLAPALAASRTDLVRSLGHGRGVSRHAGVRRRGFRGALTVIQVALSVVLLSCAGAAVQALRSAQRTDPGFDPRGVVVATFAPRLQGYDRVRSEAFFRRAVDEVRSLSEVASAGLASHLPLTIEVLFESVAADGAAASDPADWPRVDAAKVGPGFFEVLRVPLLEGRAFRSSDDVAATWVAVVNETFARRFWPDGRALGRRLRVAGTEGLHEVVGVVADGKYRTLDEPPRPFLYLALEQSRWRRSGHAGEISTGTETLVARAAGDAGAALGTVRQRIRDLDETLAVARLTTFEEALAPVLWLPRTAAFAFGLFAALGLLLAATGIYGVTAFAAGRRRHEVGVRLALGARPADVERLIVGGGVSRIAAGLVLGLGGSWVAAGALSAWLHGVRPWDLGSLGLAVSLLVAVAAFASWLPARRVAQLDPTVALRQD